jgi:hypothetical protein
MRDPALQVHIASNGLEGCRDAPEEPSRLFFGSGHPCPQKACRAVFGCPLHDERRDLSCSVEALFQSRGCRGVVGESRRGEGVALLVGAGRHHRGASNVSHPTDSGLLAKAVNRIVTTGRRIRAAGGAVRTKLRDRSRAAGRRAHDLNAKRALRRAEPMPVSRRPTSRHDSAAGRRRGRLARAVNDLAELAGGDPPDCRADPAAAGRDHTRWCDSAGQSA